MASLRRHDPDQVQTVGGRGAALSARTRAPVRFMVPLGRISPARLDGMSPDGDERRARLQRAQLYLVCDRRSEDFLQGALRGGVDMIQLRDKHASDEEVLQAAPAFRRACDEHDALFLVNDRPELAVAAGADGVHVGQDDVPLTDARGLVGPDRLVGLSTHSPAQVEAGAEADYLAVGPVHATPTKPGRPAVGLGPVRHAAKHADGPWFAIGGIGRRGSSWCARSRTPTTRRPPRARCAGPCRRAAALGRRSRKRRTATGERERRPDAVRTGYARSRERTERTRAELEPLAPGERPTAVTVAAVVALVLALANLALWAAGVEVRGEDPTFFSILVFEALMLTAAWGLWKARYWAVLGFQALLAIAIIFSALSLTVASNLRGVVVCLGILLPAGFLFWKLVRAMARLQMPERRPTRQ
jgi:thiamine-phosphate pyrophosphorylase